MSQFKMFVYKSFHILCISCFTTCAIFLLFAIARVVIFPYIISLLVVVAVISFVPLTFLQFTNLRLWELWVNDPILYRMSPEYQYEERQFWIEFFPTWAQYIFGAMVLYFFAQLAAVDAGGSLDATATYYLPGIRVGLAFLVGVYWLLVWFWHTQVVRLEKSLAAPIETP